jgi:hypothetical protein
VAKPGVLNTSMGSDASVYVFDYARYRREVVPVVQEWLRTLQFIDPIDATFVADEGTQFGRPIAGTNLVADSTTLGADLRFLGEPNQGDEWFDAWSARRCASSTCPSRTTCPWHQEETGPGNTANALIEWLIGKAGCLGERAFVGRTVTTGQFAVFLDACGFPPATRLRQLLDALGSRGRIVGYMWGGSAEGIHGWLDGGETRELAGELDGLELPDVGSTPDEVEADRRARLRRSDPGSFEPWSLAVLRAVARMAQARGHGLLWGNDVSWSTSDEVEQMRARFDSLPEGEQTPRPVRPLA